MRRQPPATPFAPTTARPGSPEKVAVLRQRARLRQCLWHPQDATLRGEGCSPGEALRGGQQPQVAQRTPA
jgi:hypothetical protein